MHDPAPHRLLDALNVAGGAHDEDVDVRCRRTQSMKHVESGDIRQVDVEEDQVRGEFLYGLESGATGVGHPHRGEAGDAIHEAACTRATMKSSSTTSTRMGESAIAAPRPCASTRNERAAREGDRAAPAASR